MGLIESLHHDGQLDHAGGDERQVFGCAKGFTCYQIAIIETGLAGKLLKGRNDLIIRTKHLLLLPELL